MTDGEIRKRVEDSLDMVGLPGIEAMSPSDLSGGMRKRVGLASQQVARGRSIPATPSVWGRGSPSHPACS
jgi:ABC-type transporter Mla maintaining outer membrane lipid asymmetry ATPase subunit MlaF